MRVMLIDKMTKSLSCKGRRVVLTDKEYLLFECIISGRGKKNVSVDDLVRHVWFGREGAVGRLNISQLLFRLRRKLESLDNAAEITFSMTSGISCRFPNRCLMLKSNNLYRFLLEIIH